MKKIILVILIALFVSCENQEDICNDNCYKIIRKGELSLFLKATCEDKPLIYPYKNEAQKEYKVGDIICDLDFN